MWYVYDVFNVCGMCVCGVCMMYDVCAVYDVYGVHNVCDGCVCGVCVCCV